MAESTEKKDGARQVSKERRISESRNMSVLDVAQRMYRVSMTRMRACSNSTATHDSLKPCFILARWYMRDDVIIMSTIDEVHSQIWVGTKIRSKLAPFVKASGVGSTFSWSVQTRGTLY